MIVLYREEMMETHINSWGNSLAVRLPKNVLEAFGLSNGAAIDLSVTDDGILLRPIKAKDPIEAMLEMTKGVDIDKKCSQITENNRPLPEDFDFGSPMGKEIW